MGPVLQNYLVIPGRYSYKCNTNNFNLIPRRDYIDLLNANTLSLDAKAKLNAGLRDTILEENWNKHDLAMTFLQMALDMAHSVTLLFEAEVS